MGLVASVHLGELVPGSAASLVAVTIPHVAIVVFWNVSGHVLYATVPAGVLIAADRRFVPLALVPLGRVFARPLAGAYTWPEAIAGILLGVAVLLALRVRGVVEPRPGAPA